MISRRSLMKTASGCCSDPTVREELVKVMSAMYEKGEMSVSEIAKTLRIKDRRKVKRFLTMLDRVGLLSASSVMKVDVEVVKLRSLGKARNFYELDTRFLSV